jgi:hypothetical protein
MAQVKAVVPGLSNLNEQAESSWRYIPSFLRMQESKNSVPTGLDTRLREYDKRIPNPLP